MTLTSLAIKEDGWSYVTVVLLQNYHTSCV